MSYYENVIYADPGKLLNSQEFVKVVDLLYGQIQPAFRFFFTEALHAVDIKNNTEKKLFEIALILYILLSCAANLLIWIPDIQAKKDIVFFIACKK